MLKYLNLLNYFMMNLYNQLEVKFKENLIYVNLPGGETAYLKYEIKRGVMYIIKMFTPPKFRGRGIARTLIDKAIEYASKNGLTIRPVCSYAVHYFKKHVEKRLVLEEEARKELEAD